MIYSIISKLTVYMNESLEYKLSQQKHETMLDLYRNGKWIEASCLCHELIGEFNGKNDSYYKEMLKCIAECMAINARLSASFVVK